MLSKLRLRWAYQNAVLRPLWPRLGRVRLKRLGALGDELMMTGVVREIKRANPRAHVSIICRHPELFEHNPHVDAVTAIGNEPAGLVARALEPLTIHLMYEPLYAHRRDTPGHLLEHFCAQAGVECREIRSEVYLSDTERARTEAFRKQHGPYLTLHTRPGPWTPYKAWSDEGWQNVVDRWSKHFTIVQLGGPEEPHLRGTVRLAGQTKIRECFEILNGAEAHLGVASFLVHAANAVGRRSVVVCGGYEAPGTTSYPGDETLSTPLECAPCWRRSDCPFDVRCMREITAEMVSAKIEKLVGSGNRR